MKRERLASVNKGLEMACFNAGMVVSGSGFLPGDSNRRACRDITLEEDSLMFWCIIAPWKVSANFLREINGPKLRGSFEASHISLPVIPESSGVNEHKCSKLPEMKKSFFRAKMRNSNVIFVCRGAPSVRFPKLRRGKEFFPVCLDVSCFRLCHV